MGPALPVEKKIKKEKKSFRICLTYNTGGGTPKCPQKKSRPIGPAVWPAIGNIYIYTNVLFYYVDYIIKCVFNYVISGEESSKP